MGSRKNSKKRSRSKVASNSQESDKKDETPLEKLRKTEEQLSETFTDVNMGIGDLNCAGITAPVLEDFNGIHMGTTKPQFKKKRGKKSTAADLGQGDEKSSSQSKGDNSEGMITSCGDNSSQPTENSQVTIPQDLEVNQHEEVECKTDENNIMGEAGTSKENETKIENRCNYKEISEQNMEQDEEVTSMTIGDCEVSKETENKSQGGSDILKETESVVSPSVITRDENIRNTEQVEARGDVIDRKNHANENSSASSQVDADTQHVSNTEATESLVQNQIEDVTVAEQAGNQTGITEVEPEQILTEKNDIETIADKSDGQCVTEETKISTNKEITATWEEMLTTGENDYSETVTDKINGVTEETKISTNKEITATWEEMLTTGENNYSETITDKINSVTEETKISTNKENSATQEEMLTTGETEKMLLKKEVTLNLESSKAQGQILEDLIEGSKIEIPSLEENERELEDTMESKQGCTSGEKSDSHQNIMNEESASEGTRKLKSKSKSFNMEDTFIVEHEAFSSKSMSEGNLTSQASLNSNQPREVEKMSKLHTTVSLSDGQIKSTKGDPVETLHSETSSSENMNQGNILGQSSGYIPVEAFHSEISSSGNMNQGKMLGQSSGDIPVVSQNESESSSYTCNKDIESEDIQDTDLDIDTQTFLPTTDVESQAKACDRNDTATVHSVSTESAPTNMEGMEDEEMTDSQLCSLDWNDGMNTSTDLPGKPARVVPPCPVSSQPSEPARVVPPCPVSSQPIEPADGTKVVQGLIKELVALNQSLVKTKREMEAARKKHF